MSPSPDARTLGGLLAAQARSSPRKLAAICDGVGLSFEALDSAASDFAKSLIAIGVGRGQRVAAVLPNSAEWLICCFGTARAGAVFVPINTWYKEKELGTVLRQSRPTLVLAASGFLGYDYTGAITQLMTGIAGTEPGRLRVEDFPDLRTVVFVGKRVPGVLDWDGLLDGGRQVDPETLRTRVMSVDPADPAYVLYTSGSTSHPKGVTLHHGSLVENGYRIGERRAIGPEDVMWIGSPLFYSVGAVSGMPAAMTHGATIVVQSRFEAGSAIATIQAHACTVYNGVGAMTRAILDHPDYRHDRIASLQKGNAGISREYKRLTLVEMSIPLATSCYGLTESYGNCTGGLTDEPLEVKLETDGLPLPGFDLKIVDSLDGGRLRPGELGQVCIRGHVSSGYFENSTVTAASFDSDGFLITGDLGSLDASGRFRFHSRASELIKRSGINISPREVEEALLSHSAVRQAQTVTVPDPARGELIVAFVELGGGVSADALRQHVRAHHASFKVPDHIFFCETSDWPRLGSGKIALAKLRERAAENLRLIPR